MIIEKDRTIQSTDIIEEGQAPVPGAALLCLKTHSCSTNKNELIVQLGYAKLIIDHHFQNPTHSST